MPKMKIFIELSDDLMELLSDNNLSVDYILDSEDIDAEVGSGASPYQKEKGAKTRDLITVVSIIGASSTAVIAIAYAVTTVLETLQKKPIYQTYWELEEIRKKDGGVILDKDGNPVMKKVKKYILLEPGNGDKKDGFEISSGLKGLVMKFSTEKKRQATD